MSREDSIANLEIYLGMKTIKLCKNIKICNT